MIVFCERVAGAGVSHGGHRDAEGNFVVCDQEVSAVRVSITFEDDVTYQFGLTRDECRIMAATLNKAACDG